MLIYLIIGIVLFFLSVFSVIRNDTEKMEIGFLEIIFCLLPLLLLVSIRTVGFDYEAYANAYDYLHYTEITNILNDIQFEAGYVLLNIISPTFIFLIFFLGLVTLTIKYKAIYSLSPYPVVSILLLFLAYLLNFEMGQIRQALAMSLALYSIQFYKSKKKFIFYVLIAILFHYSAIIFLFILFIPKKIKKLNFYAMSLIVAVFLYFTIEPLFVKISNYLPGFGAAKLMYYYEDEKGQIGISLPLVSLKFLLLFLFLSFKSRIIELCKPLYEYIFNIYFLSVFIYIAFAFFPQIAGRGGVYFSIFDIILIPIILKAIKNPYFRVLTFVLFSIIYGIMFTNFLNTWEISFIPYQSWII